MSFYTLNFLGRSKKKYKFLGLLIFLISISGALLFAQNSETSPEKRFHSSGQLSYRDLINNSLKQDGKINHKERHFNLLLSPNVQNNLTQELGITKLQLKEILDKNLKLDISKNEHNPIITLEYVNAATEENAIASLEVLMTTIIEESRRLNANHIVNRIGTLEANRRTAQREIAAAEQALYSFLSGTEGNKLLTIEDGTIRNEINQNKQKQREIQVSLEKLQGQIDSIIKRLGLSSEEAYVSATLSSDPILSNLRSEMLEIESEIKLREKDLRPDHPKMINLHKQLTNKEKVAQQRVTEVLGNDETYDFLPSKLRQKTSLNLARQELANNLVNLQTQKAGIKRQLTALQQTESKLRSQFVQYPDSQVQKTRLSQEVATKKALYEKISTALVNAKAQETEINSSYAIAQSPIVQEVNSINIAGNNRYLILLTGGGIGLVSAVGVLLVANNPEESLLTVKEVKEIFAQKNIPLLGSIPFVHCFNLEGYKTGILADPNSDFIDFYEKVRINLRRKTNEHCKTIVVTSITAEEGKTLTAYNLAIAYANTGKRTLIIEANLRSQSQGNLLRVTPDPEIAAEPLKYFAEHQETIWVVPIIVNLYMIPSPGQLNKVPAILESEEFQVLIDNAKERFDVIIIDTPPLDKCSDALLLESFTDGIVLVNQPGIVEQDAITENLDSLLESESSLLGVVINNPQEKLVLSVN